MADTKISALTGATTPLAGTEVVPIVQGGQTRKVATDNLTVKNVRSNATTGILQVAGPSTGTTRTMTTPDANFTAARTDAGQTFSGTQTFGSGVTISGGKLTAINARGGDFVAEFQNTTSATPYCVWIKDASGSTAGYPLLNISDSAGTTTYFRLDSGNGNQTLGIGNLVIGTSGKGIDFSATSGSGTSELLADYEEGTWTPVDGSGAGLVFTGVVGVYTKVGRVVNYFGDVTYPVTANGSGSIIAGLPFTSSSSLNATGNVISTTANAVGSAVPPSTSVVLVFPAGSLTPPTNAALSTARIIFAGSYQV